MNHPQLINLPKDCGVVLSISFSNSAFSFLFSTLSESLQQVLQFFVDAKNWIHKSRFHQLGPELWFLKSGFTYHLCCLFHVCFLFCLFCQFFCLTLYYYFIFICFISLSISIFFELYLVSISFCIFYKYSIKIRAKKGKKEVKKKEIQFSDLEAIFCYSLDLDFSNHIFAFEFELCAKKSAEIEKWKKKK